MQVLVVGQNEHDVGFGIRFIGGFAIFNDVLMILLRRLYRVGTKDETGDQQKLQPGSHFQ